MSSSFGMPGVNSAGPKHKTLLVVAKFLNDVGFGRQMHCTYGFLADRRSSAFKRCSGDIAVVVG
jgi:hypothetical protein